MASKNILFTVFITAMAVAVIQCGDSNEDKADAGNDGAVDSTGDNDNQHNDESSTEPKDGEEGDDGSEGDDAETSDNSDNDDNTVEDKIEDAEERKTDDDDEGDESNDEEKDETSEESSDDNVDDSTDKESSSDSDDDSEDETSNEEETESADDSEDTAPDTPPATDDAKETEEEQETPSDTETTESLTDTDSATPTDTASEDEATDDLAYANVTEVAVSGNENSYTFNVTLETADIDCDQFADWWEILDADGNLIYRRILTHPHTEGMSGNPFTRGSQSPVNVETDQQVIIRAHMNNTGYVGTVMKGSVEEGFVEAPEIGSDFAPEVENEGVQPEECVPE